jgi:hypothetical protein
MTSTLDSFQSSRFLPVETPETPCVDNEDALHHRIVDACQTIGNYPGIFVWMLRTIRRVEACIESHGEHFWHLL